MRTRSIRSLITTLGLAASAAGAQQTTTVNVVVRGQSDPWLAGMPAGSTASYDDVAPAQSPAQVLGINFSLGGYLTFTASGLVWHPTDIAGPEGSLAGLPSHAQGAENGISNVVAPFNALMGVFLGPNLPTSMSAPGALSFATAAERDFLTLSPALQQVFFIGNGFTSLGAAQQFFIPTGATRLFLGPMDSQEWADNGGAFDVTVTAVQPTATATPEPATLLLLGAGLVPLGAAARRRRAA